MAEPLTAEGINALRVALLVYPNDAASRFLATIDARDAEIARLGERIAALTTVADDKLNATQHTVGALARTTAERDAARAQLAAATTILGSLATAYNAESFCSDEPCEWLDVKQFLSDPTNAAITKRIAALEAEHAAGDWRNIADEMPAASRLVLASNGQRCAIAYYVPELLRKGDDGSSVPFGWAAGSTGLLSELPFAPTHWRELPPQPAVAAVEGEG